MTPKPKSPSSPARPKAPSASSAPSRPKASSSPGSKRTGKKIVVDLSTNIVRLIEDSITVRTMKTSSGRPGFPTPRGNFRIHNKQEEHASNRYGTCVDEKTEGNPVNFDRGENLEKRCPKGKKFKGAPMRFYQPLGSNFGFHAGNTAVQSHGCLHLEPGDAGSLYKWTDEGTPVEIGPNASRKKSTEQNKKK